MVTSAKKTFFAGANLKTTVQATPADAPAVFAFIEEVKATLRALEKLPRPVVAAINGAALGGGFEITLACQHRILVDDPKAEVGLPEASLGLLPGGGGVTRVTRMLGIQAALMDVLLQGTRFRPADALDKGLVDALVPTREELLPAAKAWILDHRDDEAAAYNAWDRPGYKMPGGTPKSPALAAFLPAFPALLRQQTKGAVYPAQRAILSASVEGASVDFDTASRIESRYLTKLVVGQNSKNMIQAFFFDLQAINAGKLRPEGFETFRATKVAVLGAGMMGAGIAYSCARAGMDVLLKDVSAEAAERGKAYSEKLLDKAIARGRSTEEKKAELLGRITPTGDAADLAGCDLVIEAVFEDPGLKHQVFAEVAPHVNDDALLCSNTSTLPITELATGVDRPADFIGLHFFSPVDKMPLVEIIRGKETSDAALAKAYDVVQQIRKTPIVVNDSRGFYTSRVIGTMVNEGLAMLAEGVHPMSLERAATQAGYPVGTLQLSDELNMELMLKIAKATADAAERDGIDLAGTPGHRRGPPDGRDRPSVAARGRRLLRLRRPRSAYAPLARPGRDVPRRRGADPVRRREGPDALRRGARDRQVLRGRCHHLRGRRQHRLDHGHRLPAQHRWRRAVHDRLRVGDGRDRAGGVRRPLGRARGGVRRAVPAHRQVARDGGKRRALPCLRHSGSDRRCFPERLRRVAFVIWTFGRLDVVQELLIDDRSVERTEWPDQLGRAAGVATRHPAGPFAFPDVDRAELVVRIEVLERGPQVEHGVADATVAPVEDPVVAGAAAHVAGVEVAVHQGVR